ncbi:TPA: cytochrome c oxidase subunit 2A [Acinetobacter nosocomialis]|nr:cytochrome c oxidase subunit 2A [Acinetobacter nosocomialis]
MAKIWCFWGNVYFIFLSRNW